MVNSQNSDNQKKVNKTFNKPSQQRDNYIEPNSSILYLLDQHDVDIKHVEKITTKYFYV